MKIILLLVILVISGCATTTTKQQSVDVVPEQIPQGKAIVIFDASINDNDSNDAESPMLVILKDPRRIEKGGALDKENKIQFTNYPGKEVPFYAGNAPYRLHAYLIDAEDNTGPYRSFPASSSGGTGYSMEQIVYAMPLLPPDVFMSGEEALSVGLTVIADLYQGFNTEYSKTVLEESASKIAIRILLVEKRKLRSWAASTLMPKELHDVLRNMDLPKRVWVLELHIKDIYGSHGKANAPSLIGFILIDPTGDIVTNAVLMFYINKNYPSNIIPLGSFVQFNDKGLPYNGTQTTDTTPLQPIRT